MIETLFFFTDSHRYVFFGIWKNLFTEDDTSYSIFGDYVSNIKSYFASFERDKNKLKNQKVQLLI